MRVDSDDLWGIDHRRSHRGEVLRPSALGFEGELDPEQASVDWREVQRILRAFERDREGGARHPLGEYLPPEGPLRKTVLVELAHAELELRLKAGEEATAWEYLNAHPELRNDPELAAELTAAEQHWRQVRRGGPTVETFAKFEPVVTSVAGSPAVPQRLGRYALEAVIGRGSFGLVYRAHDTQLGRKVALKVPRPGSLTTSVDIDRFLREARVAARLSHPGIVPVHDVGCSGETCYLVSELVDGSTLADRLASGPLPPREAARLVSRVARALEYAHRQGVVHRDLKPSNILLDAHQAPRITDFGLAKHDFDESTLTLEGQVLGTPAYLPPEQARGQGHAADARSDIYSLGVILYQAVTGEVPFRGNVRMLLEQVLLDEPRPPRRLNDLVPRDLETICLKAMAKEPGLRYQEAGALADDLERYLDGRPILARPTPGWQRVLRWARRRPTIAALSVLVLVTAALGFVGIAWEWRQADAARKLADERAEAEAKTARALAASLYQYRIALADREIEASNGSRARELLEQIAPQDRGWEWRHLDRKLAGARASAVLAIESERCFDLAYSLDGRVLAAALWNGTVVLHDTGDGRALQTITAHPEPVHSVAFSPDARRLLTCGGEGRVRIWDVSSGAMLQDLPTAGDGTWDAAFDHDARRVAAGDNRGRVFVWDSATGELCWSLPAHEDRLWDVEFTPDGQILATASSDGTVKLWEAGTGRLCQTLTHQFRQNLFCVAISPDSSLIAAAGGGGWVSFWELPSGRPVRTLQLHTFAVTALVFNPAGDRFAFSGTDRNAIICETRTGSELIRLHGSEDEVWSLAFNPRGDQLASAGWDRKIRIWDASPIRDGERPELFVLTGHKGSTLDVAFHPDGYEAASCGDDGRVRIWSLDTGRELTLLSGHTSAVTSLVYSPDGTLLLTGSRDRTARLWDRASGRTLRVLQGHSASIASVAFSPDGRLLATAGWDRKLRLWDAAGGRELRYFEEPDGFVVDAAFSPDGSKIVSASTQTVQLREIRTGRLLWKVDAQDERVMDLALSPDGLRVATCGRGPLVRLWSLRDGSAYGRFSGMEGRADGVAFSPDGKSLAAAGVDRTIRIWDAATFEPRAVLRGHSDRLTGIAFSRDGQFIASSSGDHTVRIWKVP